MQRLTPTQKAVYLYGILLFIEQRTKENGKNNTRRNSKRNLLRNSVKIEDLHDMGEKRNKLRHLFPEITSFEFSKWSPFGDIVILQWWNNETNIALWVETSIEDDPTKKEDLKCRFVKISKESYELLCENEKENEQ